jgi:D-glycero-D-manno-heptose 1,7-bisphosphate phosphatase
MKRAVFLDRDGVLNRSILVDGVPTPPSCAGDVEILGGVVEAIQILINLDFVPVVVTNQPDVARGVASQAQIEAINECIGAVTNIKYFYTCFHDDSDHCDCRKPAPGLLLQAAKDLGLDTHQSIMIGDRWRDITAGQAAGCQTFFIDYSYAELGPSKPFITVTSLLEAANIIKGEFSGSR